MNRSSPFYTPDHEAFRGAVRRFVAREITPHVEAWEAQGSFPLQLHRQAAELGLLGGEHAGSDVMGQQVNRGGGNPIRKKGIKPDVQTGASPANAIRPAGRTPCTDRPNVRLHILRPSRR